MVCYCSASNLSCVTRVDLSNLLFVEPAGVIFTIAGDERDGVASIEQTDHGLDLMGPEMQRLRDVVQVDGQRGAHNRGAAHTVQNSRRNG